MSYVERRLGLTALTAIIVAVALFLAVGATVLGTIALVDVSEQSTKNCEVQSRGLAANKEILPVWEGLNFLIEPHDGVPQAPVAPLFRPALQEIKTHLPRYLALQRLQPAARKC